MRVFIRNVFQLTIPTVSLRPLPCALCVAMLMLSAVAVAQDSVAMGGAVAVDVSNQLAVTADRSGSVRLFDARKADAPTLLASVTIARKLTGVALAGRYLLVSGAGGVQVLDITNPNSPIVENLVELDGDAVAVRAAGNLGFTAVGSSMVLFDIPTGKILDRHDYSKLPVSDLTLSGDYVYALYAGGNSASGFEVVKLRIQGSLGEPVALWSAPTGQTGLGRMSLVAADGLLYLGSVVPAADEQTPGFEILEDLGASFELQGSVQPVGASMVRPSGQGLLAYAGATGAAATGGHLGVADVSEPGKTPKVLHLFDIHGQAQALTLNGGYAYVAAGSAGLQVTAYTKPNGSQDLPTVSVSTSVIAETPEQGSLGRLSAKVTAGDQVREVDFFLNGEEVASVEGYPFEYRFFEADKDLEASQMVTACAEDVDGNSACSTPVELNPNNTGTNKNALSVVAVTPTTGSSSPRSSKLGISAQFSLPLDLSTVVAANATVTRMATVSSKSSTIPVSGVTYEAGTNSIAIHTPSALASGTYQVVLNSAIKSASGLSMPANYSWIFNVTPVTDTWASAVSGDWNVAANWSLGISPATGDNVVINAPGVSVSLSSGSSQIGSLTVAATDALNISGGSLTVTAPSTVSGTLNLSNGSLGGPSTAALTIALMNWTGGTLGGTLSIPVGGVMNIVTPSQGCCSPALFSMSAATINNSGTVNHSWTGGGYGLYIYNNSVINNAGAWNLTSDVAVTEGDATSSVFNNTATGKFNKIGGANTSNWSMPFAGGGAINLQSGTLSLNGTYTKTITGTIAIGTQAQLNYGQGGTLDGGKVTGTGTLNFNASTSVEGVYSFAGVTGITGGTTTFQGATSITTLNLSGGTMIGTGPVTISGTMNWTGGTLGGTLNIPAGAVMNIVTPSQGCCSPTLFSMSAATINNSGTVNHSWTGGGYGLYVYNSSVINNAGTWNLTSDVAVTQGDASGSVFNNAVAGKFNKIGGTNTSYWSMPFAGAGAINLQSGTLSLNGTYSKTITATIAIGTQAQLNYGQGGTLDGGKVTGTGTLNLNASAIVEGTYSFAGVTDITAGTATFTGATTIATLNLSGGTLIGTGPVTVSGTMNWTGGTLGGTLNIPVGAVMNIVTPSQGCCSPTLFSMSAATINNSGTVNQSWTGSGYGLYVYNLSSINNAGTWNVTSDVAVTQGDASSTVFNNASTGTFNKIGGTNTSNWSMPFAGAGAINIQSGTLSLNGTYTKTISGAISIGGQAQLNYGQGGTLSNGAVSGTGTMSFTAATTVTGAYSFAGVTDVTGGSVAFKGTNTIATLNLSGGTTTFSGATSAAMLNLSGGSMIGAAPVTVSGTMNWTAGTLGGTLSIAAGGVMNIVTPTQGCCSPALFSMSAATINNGGTVNHSWTGGGYGLYIYNNSVINNAGTWNLTSDVLVTQGDGTSSAFNNTATGKFNKVGGTNTSNWSMPFGGAGAVNLQSGTLSLNGTYTKTITATIAIGGQAQLIYGQGGTLDGGKVTGTGAMNFNASTTVEGSYSFAGLTYITGGTIDFTGSTSIANLNLSGGTLIGTAP